MTKEVYSQGALVRVLSGIFGVLKKLSIFSAVRWTLKKLHIETSYNFVDYWVLGNLVGAGMAAAFAYYCMNQHGVYRALSIVFAAYATVRIFEIVIYQINVVLFDCYQDGVYKKDYLLKSVQRTILALLCNYAEIMLWYAVIIIVLLQLQGGTIAVSFSRCIMSSVIAAITFDIGTITALYEGAEGFLFTAAFGEVLVGVIMNIISLARFVGLLPAPRTLSEESADSRDK